MLLLIALGCEVFALIVFLVIRLVFPPIEPIVLTDADRECIAYAERMGREKGINLTSEEI